MEISGPRKVPQCEKLHARGMLSFRDSPFRRMQIGESDIYRRAFTLWGRVPLANRGVGSGRPHAANRPIDAILSGSTWPTNYFKLLLLQ